MNKGCPLVNESMSRWEKSQKLRSDKQYVKVSRAIAVQNGRFRAELIGFKKNGTTTVLPMSDFTTYKIAKTVFDCI